jgi:hypothetical protein
MSPLDPSFATADRRERGSELRFLLPVASGHFRSFCTRDPMRPQIPKPKRPWGFQFHVGSLVDERLKFSPASSAPRDATAIRSPLMGFL